MGYILKGIGDKVTGKNEIVPTFDAKIYNFFAQSIPGVIASEKNKFPISLIDRGIIIGPGLAQAFGYFGVSDASVQFNFIIPSGQTQYAKVYAEFDLSARPQSFSIKVTPQSNTNIIELTQDDLSEIPAGVYQLPLYLVTLQINGTISFTDIRELLERISYSNHSLESDHTLESDHSLQADNATLAQRIVYTTTLPSSSPPAGTLIIYNGTSVPATRYDRVLYLISVWGGYAFIFRK